MKYIGNKIWHEATDNSEKMMCHISKEQFKSMQRILDSASLNYYTCEKENICRVAVNKSDIAMIRSLLSSYIDFSPTSFSYSPASMNIFGTVAYKEIHPKRYLNGEHDVMLKIADTLMKQGIPFSGRSYDSQTTITVSPEYLDAASAIARQIRIQRDNNHIPVSAEPIETIAEELTSSPIEKKSDEGDLQHELSINESIQSAFSAVKQEFTLSEKQLQFLERLERFAVSNNITENLLDSAFEKSHAFRAAYGSPKQLSKNVFAGRMQRIMKVLEERLTEGTVSEAEKEHTAGSYYTEKSEKDQEASSDIQLYLFPDEPESQVQSQSNSDSSPLFVGDVNIFDALHNELMRGSGFTEGKFRIQEFYQTNQPSVSEFARMLKNEYGIGGHSVNDDSGLWLVNHDGKGLEFCVHTDTEDEAFRFSWNDTAKYLSELIEKNEYITQEDIERREKRTAQETKQPIIENTIAEEIVQEETQSIIENESPSAFNIPSITDSLKADFDSGKLTFKEVAAELKRANLIAHERDYKRTAELIGIDQADQRISEYFTEKTPVPAEQESSERTEIRSEKTESLETGENKSVQAENDKDNDISHKSYRIYQLKGGEEYYGIRFTNYERLEKDGYKPNYADYDFVYQGKQLNPDIPDGDLLESIYTIFNLDHPEDFMGHSLSVSDVVVIDEADKSTAYFVDSVGYKELPEFFMERGITVEKAEVDQSELSGEQLSTSSPAETKSDKYVTITCNWSESPVFEEGKTYTVAEFDRIMAEADKERHEGWKAGLEKYGSDKAWEMQDAESYYRYLGYDKTSFTVNLPNGDSITERQDIGDGYGGVIDFFRSFESLKQYVPILETQRDLDNAVREREEMQTVREKTSVFIEIDSETAAGMFVDGGFEVYNKDSVLVPDHAYIIENSEQAFKAAAEDVEVFAMREEIALKIDDISSAYELTTMEFGEPYHLDLMRSASSNFGWNSFNDGKNVYENVMAALRENNLDVLREYLDEVCNIENGTRSEDMANETIRLLDSYADKYINNELTEKEKSFLDMNAVEFITKGVLSWDEVESLSYIFFEEGYTERHKPSEKSLYGRGLKETEAYRLAERYRNGEDISREIVKALIGSDGERRTDLLNDDNEYSLEKCILKYTDNTITVSYGNASLEATYAEIAQFFLDRMENEYRDIERARAEEAEITVKAESQNFTITDDTFGEGGAKSKFKDNIAAIETLKIIEAEKRPATPEEQNILARYVGWGGLQAAFDSDNKAWTSEYALLKETLTDKEYSAARASTLDSFYTSPTVIDGIYDALDSFGFTGGNVLEPAMGIGNFFGRMPEDMQKKSQLYGVEIDSISGRIAQKLYPDADIAIQGFEKNVYQKGSFDIAVGNVPFGDLGFKDEKHGTTKLHDYFFAETLDKVKNGGIVAFVTSAGTLDKRDESTRQMLADKADLIGAVRLPGGKNGAFKDYAGTEATTDIIFLQKHNNKSVSEMSDVPDWVHIGQTEDGLPINKYFENHPDMVLGTVIEGNKLYGTGTMVVAEDGSDLKAQLHEAVSKLTAQISDERPRDVYTKAKETEIRPPEELRNYSLFLDEHSNKVCFKYSDAVAEIWKHDKSANARQKAADYIKLRDATRQLLNAQEDGCSDAQLTVLQKQLNTLYDDFYSKHGLLHSRSNRLKLSQDVSYPLVCALEAEFENDKLIRKSDVFTKRTIKPHVPVEQVDTAQEALTLSIAETARVDFDYMQSLTGMPREALIEELKDCIYPVPELSDDSHIVYQEASEYLSGDIRQKLDTAIQAAEKNAVFAANIPALENVMPPPLKAGDIDVKLGAMWIEPKYYQQFMYEVFNTPESLREKENTPAWMKHLFAKHSAITLEYSEHTGAWFVTNKSADKSVNVTKAYGTDKASAYHILENALNLKDPKVYKTEYVNGEEKRVIDLDKTRQAQRKADKIREAFKNWVFKDPQRREELVEKYNRTYNSIRPREYDGSHLSFPGMNSDIQLHSHQKNAVAHAIYGGNTLFAHSVGAGKTFEMIAAAMESKRLGLCSKSLFAVPNHLTEQIGDDFMKLYPNANILVATKNDFAKENRQKLISKIATGNFDAIIIGHSQLGMIPLSKERREAQLEEQIQDIIEGIAQLKKDEGSKFQVKAMERTRKSLEKQLEKLRKESQDDVVTFEQLGVDRLFVDEAHEFKNLFCPTKLQNVAGISGASSQKALDLFLKCRYLDEKTGSRGVIFATGTPISNSITELHTMMRFLQYDFLKQKQLHHFDNWISIFGEQKTDYELAPAGNKFRQRTRIANYSNLPELISMFKQCADVKTAEMLCLDVPDSELHIVNVEPTELQKTLVAELAARADEVQAGKVQPEDDNMLRITGDGRKLGLDPRLINPDFQDEPHTKLNQCVENVFRIYEDTTEKKLTQIVFCDLGVPHKSASTAKDGADAEEVSIAEANSLEEECDFCVYDDIKQKLIDKGVPENEIAYIHNAKSEKQKSELFDQVRSGEVRVLLGSTSKMGTGTNVQNKLIALHDLDVPWRPADLEQRKGRIVRQGNENENVHVYRYVTKGTFDAYSYQLLEKKQNFISQVNTPNPARSCEDVDQQALTYSEIKTLCTGDERIKELMVLENEVRELKSEKTEYQNTHYDMEDKLKHLPIEIARCERFAEAVEADIAMSKRLPMDAETNSPALKLEIKGRTYTAENRTDAAKALEKLGFNLMGYETADTAECRIYGLPVTLRYAHMAGCVQATIHAAQDYTVDFTKHAPTNLKRLESCLSSLETKKKAALNRAAACRVDIKDAERILAEPFTKESELVQKSERLNTLREELNQAAADAVNNDKSQKRTHYFDMARLRASSRRLAGSKSVTRVKKGQEI